MPIPRPCFAFPHATHNTSVLFITRGHGHTRTVDASVGDTALGFLLSFPPFNCAALADDAAIALDVGLVRDEEESWLVVTESAPASASILVAMTALGGLARSGLCGRVATSF